MTIRKFKPISAKFITGVAMLALMAGASLALSPQAFAEDCLLDSDDSGDANAGDTDGGADSSGDNLRLACGVGASAAGINSTALGNGASAAGPDSTAMGREASAAGTRSIALGRNAVATETDSIALGNSANAGGTRSTALGRSADAAGVNSTAVGSSTSAGGTESTALGRTANAAGERSIALGFSADAGVRSIALGGFSNAGERATSVGYGSDTGLNAVALGGDSTADIDTVGAQALGDNSIAIGADASDGSFADAVIIGKGATATEADQVILKSADTFTIMGNGDVGIGTAAPMGNLDINSGVDDTVLLLTNTSAQWELKSKAATGRLNFKNLTDGGVPFKLGPSAVNALLSVGTAADDLVEVRGELMVEGDVDVTGTLTTGGPTCGGGCDAVFGEDYDLPSIEEHAAAMFTNHYLPQVGPTVPHAPMNISEKVGDMLNELEKAHNYIAQINAEKRVLETRLTRQMSINQDQDARLAKLETLLTP